jgi:hypothetical protein
VKIYKIIKVIGIHVKWGINSFLKANLLEKIMASIPLLLKELDWDFTSFLFVNLVRESVTKLHGESSSNGFIRECKFGDVHAYWEKDLNSKTYIRTFMQVITILPCIC